MPHSCPAISTPEWALPSFAQAPGSWLLVAALALVGIACAPRVVMPVSPGARIPVALTYGLAVVMLVAAVVVFALILPAYQSATWTEFLGFQPGASSAATDCALAFLGVARTTGTAFTQSAQLELVFALISGAICGWIRMRWQA